jgi:hypothetical protein
MLHGVMSHQKNKIRVEISPPGVQFFRGYFDPYAGVDGGLSEGSSMCRPGKRTPIDTSVNFVLYLSVISGVVRPGILSNSF